MLAKHLAQWLWPAGQPLAPKQKICVREMGQDFAAITCQEQSIITGLVYKQKKASCCLVLSMFDDFKFSDYMKFNKKKRFVELTCNADFLNCMKSFTVTKLLHRLNEQVSKYVASWTADFLFY